MRLLGVNLPDNKNVETALTYVYGVGRPLSKKILAAAKIDGHKRTKDLTQDDLSKIQEQITGKVTIEGELRREKILAIRRLEQIGCWRGLRHRKGLPARGQATRHNSRTVRGNVRRTVATAKKAAPAPK